MSLETTRLAIGPKLYIDNKNWSNNNCKQELSCVPGEQTMDGTTSINSIGMEESANIIFYFFYFYNYNFVNYNKSELISNLPYKHKKGPRSMIFNFEYGLLIPQ